MIRINGKSYSVSTSGNISIQNNRVFVNGKDISNLEEIDQKNIEITISGNVDRLEADYCEKIVIEGSCGNAKTGSGDIHCTGDIKGNVQTGSGDVDCEGNIHGSTMTGSGDIKYRRPS